MNLANEVISVVCLVSLLQSPSEVAALDLDLPKWLMRHQDTRHRLKLVQMIPLHQLIRLSTNTSTELYVLYCKSFI